MKPKKYDGGGYDNEAEFDNEEFGEMYVATAMEHFEEEEPEFAEMMKRVQSENVDEKPTEED